MRHRDQTEFRDSPRVAGNRTTRFARHLQRLIFRPPPSRPPKCRNYDRHPSCPKGIASFLCGRHFLRAFSSRDDAARHLRRQRSCLSYARQNNAVRNLSQTFLITAGIEARVEGSTARMPFASPYCPSLAQIRRAHVQSRTRFAVLPSMRVRSHASRLARAHHFTIPKIRGGRL